MEKAKLIIRETKKRKLCSELHFEEGNKIMPFSQFGPKDTSLNGTIVGVEREKGQIVKVQVGEQILYSTVLGRSPGNKSQKKDDIYNDKNEFQIAKAPYNFVPLNEHVVPSDTMRGEKDGNLDLSKYHKDRYTGTITLNITTKTPLYIRDTYTPADMEKEKDMKKEMEKEMEIREKNRENKTKCKYINPDFFSPGGRICIPGSSLRGMIRTLVEITGHSNFSFYEKSRKYHYRAFIDKSIDLVEEYKKKLAGERGTNNYLKNLRAGYLIKDGIEYKIKPALRIKNRQYFRVKERTVIDKGIIKAEMCLQVDKDKFKENKEYKMGNQKVKFKADKLEGKNRDIITEIFRENDPVKDAYEGSLLLSGWMRGPKKNPRGKYLHWVVGPVSNETLALAPGVMEDYKNDENRHKDANLLDYFNNKKNPAKEVPCFYVEREGKVISFGHTGLFRLAYEKTLADLVRQNREEIDIAEAIFGNETRFPGRVFFEDAYLTGDPERALEQETVIKILAKPKPTTFQHYLRQEKEKIKCIPDKNSDKYKGIDNYNSPNAQLRGYKLYWHKTNSPGNWKEIEISFSKDNFQDILNRNKLGRDHFGNTLKEENDKTIVALEKLPPKPRQAVLEAVGLYETQHTKIKAVKAGETFKGRIRFENLSGVELGALLFSLELPVGCSHKLGMGKPLGLGTIQISTGLYISDRADRYKNLFAGWAEPGEEIREQKEALKNEFAGNVLTALKHTTESEEYVEALWGLERMEHLKAMLDFENKPGNEETGYMELEEFKKRNVLPTAKEIKAAP